MPLAIECLGDSADTQIVRSPSGVEIGRLCFDTDPVTAPYWEGGWRLVQDATGRVVGFEPSDADALAALVRHGYRQRLLSADEAGLSPAKARRLDHEATGAGLGHPQFRAAAGR